MQEATRLEGQFLTAQEVAQRVGVHERTVRRWIEAGRLRATKHGASFAIRLEDAEALAGTALRRRVAALAADAEQEATLLELQGELKMLMRLFEDQKRELAEERAARVRLEIELGDRAA